MEKMSGKTLVDLFRLASKFFEDAAALTEADIRRTEILEDAPKKRAESEKGKKEEGEKAEDEKPSRSRRLKEKKQLTGYQLFVKNKAKEIKGETKNQNLQINEISAMTFELWRNLPSVEKEFWVKKANLTIINRGANDSHSKEISEDDNREDAPKKKQKSSE